MRALLRRNMVLLSVYHTLMLTYRAELYLWVLATVMPFIMMGLWSQVSAGGGFSMDPHGYKRYFLATFIVRQFTIVWMIWDFEWQVVQGRLSAQLLRPMHPLWYHVLAHLGEQLARAPFAFLIVGGFIALNPDVLTPLPDWRWVLTGIVMIYAAFALRFALHFCFATMCFWFERASSIEQLSFVPYLFLSGIMVPLADLPPTMRAVVRYTPFPYMIDFPARMLTGTMTLPDFLHGLMVIALWFIGLCLLGSALWRQGLRHYSGHGA